MLYKMCHAEKLNGRLSVVVILEKNRMKIASGGVGMFAGRLSAPGLHLWDKAGRGHNVVGLSFLLQLNPIDFQTLSFFSFSTKSSPSSISLLEWFSDSSSTSPDTPRDSPPCPLGILSYPFSVCLHLEFEDGLGLRL